MGPGGGQVDDHADAAQEGRAQSRSQPQGEPVGRWLLLLLLVVAVVVGSTREQFVLLFPCPLPIGFN